MVVPGLPVAGAVCIAALANRMTTSGTTMATFGSAFSCSTASADTVVAKELTAWKRLTCLAPDWASAFTRARPSLYASAPFRW